MKCKNLEFIKTKCLTKLTKVYFENFVRQKKIKKILINKKKTVKKKDGEKNKKNKINHLVFKLI